MPYKAAIRALIKEGANLIRSKSKIDKARKAFGNKEFKKSLEIYNNVVNKNILNNLDRNIIAHCKLN
jgi:hypothetical protein